jgi:hypothetical protein
MINSLLNVLFGCSHKRTTFPITPSRRSSLSGEARRGTYVACLDCGKEFDYSWQDMRVSNTVAAPAHTGSFSVVNH